MSDADSRAGAPLSEPLERLRQALDAAGLDAPVVRSLWQQIEAASATADAARARAAAAAVVAGAAAGSAEAALGAASKRIVILGAAGGMGQLFSRLFVELGHTVVGVDVDTSAGVRRDAVRDADVVVVSVPIRETEAVIRELGPLVRDDALLLDFTSLKSEPMRWMLESTRASVVGTHPMFGPGIHTFRGQRTVVCKGRGDAWHAWVVATLESAGLAVMVTEPGRHDRAMALVQVLTHYQTQVLGLTLARYGVSIDEPLSFTSPAYLLELYVTARHFAQAASLYGPIEMLNPETEKVTRTFQAAAAEVARMLSERDQTAFDALFAEVSGFFGDFTKEALDQSGFLIDRLVELTSGRRASARD